MKNSATIIVECDGCHGKVNIELDFDHLRQVWDDSNVDKELESSEHEWTVIDDDIHSCPDCLRKFSG